MMKRDMINEDVTKMATIEMGIIQQDVTEMATTVEATIKMATTERDTTKIIGTGMMSTK